MNSMNNIYYNNKTVLTVKTKILILLLICIIGAIVFSSSAMANSEDRDYVLLTDLNYITTNNWSYNGWDGHSIQINKNPEGGNIILREGSTTRIYAKGIGLHAKGQITYDISEYSSKYTRFTAKIGVDVAANRSSASLYFIIYSSADGNNWTQLLRTGNLGYNSQPIDVDLSIEGQKYLRIYVDPNGANTADHGVIANPQLITSDYEVPEYKEYEKLHPVSYYDNIIGNNDDYEYNYNTNYRLILEREFVNKMNYDLINSLVNADPEEKELIDWLVAEDRRLEYCIEVGNISTSSGFFELLSTLYQKYKEDLRTENGYVYEKMMIALCAGYVTDLAPSPLFFSHLAAKDKYDCIGRFDVMKELFDEGQFKRISDNSLNGSDWVSNEWFKDLHIDLIRMIMIPDWNNEDIKWMNGYTHRKNSLSYYMVPYITPIYTQARLYDPANKDTFNSKYFLDELGVPYGDDVQRMWMVVEAGNICWGQSRFGSAAMRANGIPAVGAYGTSHELYYRYIQREDGKGYWSAEYGTWQTAGTTWWGGNKFRYIFDWANKSFTDQLIKEEKVATSTGYLYLAQDNLNRLSAYQKSLYYDLMANSYSDKEKKAQIYLESLDVNNINLDTYEYIINLYKTMDKTSSDWYDLSLKIIDSYTYYPVAMYDLLKLTRPYLEGAERLDIDRLEKAALQTALTAKESDVLQYGAVQGHARQLLGLTQADPMSFSFDGENAGKIVENPNYLVPWGYSLDGGKTFTPHVQTSSIQLTAEELASITSEDDIIISFMGLPDFNFIIDITEGAVDTSTLFCNDLENRIIGTSAVYEWRHNEEESWTSFATELPDNTGDVTLYVRKAATGRALASDAVTYTFTADNQPDTRKYVPVSHLSLQACSSEAVNNSGSAKFALDANYNTRWHSDWGGSDTQRFITIKLDQPRYISSVEFVPAGGGNGKINDGIIYGSVDGEKWVELTRRTGITYSNSADNVADAIANIKDFPIEDPQKVSYIKIQSTKSSNGNWFAARAFNLFEDITPRFASFHFDGDKANKIVLEDDYKGQSFKYSLDGGTTWKNGEGDEHQLQPNELNLITAENKIKVKFDNSDVIYVLDIKSGGASAIPSSVYKNDLENKMIGISNTSAFEWQLEGTDTWTSFSEENPVVEGYKKLYVRTKAKGLYTAGDPVEYQFTADTDTAERKYISIDHLSLHDFSSEATGAGQYGDVIHAIDGNLTTIWHSAWNGSDTQKFIAVKFDEPKNLTAIEYFPTGGINGKILSAKVLVSSDGENWTEIVSGTNWTYTSDSDTSMKNVEFDAVEAQYVKIVGASTRNSFITARMFNFYEDATKVSEDPEPTEEEIYQELKAESIRIITEYQAKATEEELSNKKIDEEEKSTVVEAYNKLREEDKVEFAEFINKILAGGKPVVTAIEAENITFRENTVIDLYSLITIEDNEDGDIVANEDSVKIITELDFSKAGTYDVIYEVTDSDGNTSTLTLQITIIEVSSETPLKLGDINSDGKVSVTDLAQLKLHMIGVEGKILTGDSLIAADINKNGRVDVGDLALLKLYIIGAITIED